MSSLKAIYQSIIRFYCSDEKSGHLGYPILSRITRLLPENYLDLKVRYLALVEMSVDFLEILLLQAFVKCYMLFTSLVEF